MLRSVSRPVSVSPENRYPLVGAHWYAKGLYVKEEKGGSEIQARTLFQVREGDFVYNRLFAWKGSFAVATKEVDSCFVSSEFPCFTPLDTIDPHFLWFYFSRSSVWNEALGLSSGSTPTSRNRLKEEQFLNMEVPLPPLDEQHHIVARIEELAWKLETTRSLQLESSAKSNLLMDAIISQAFEQFTQRFGVVPIINFADVKGGKRLPRGESLSDDPTPFPYIRVADMQNHSVVLSGIKYVPSHIHPAIQRYTISCEDVYITIAGTIGYPGLVPRQLDGANLTENAAKLVLRDKAQVDRRFVVYMLRSHQVQGEFSGKRTVAAQPKLALHRIATTALPLPLIVEQKRIAGYLDDLQEKIGTLKVRQSQMTSELDALMPSVLAKAFRGEL